jgi:hypothetical protein
MLASMAHPTAEGQQMRATRAEIFAALDAARRETFKLYDWLRDPRDAQQRASPNFRRASGISVTSGPSKSGGFLIRLGGATPLNPRYQAIFDPIKTPREDSDGLPRAKNSKHTSPASAAKSSAYISRTTAHLPIAVER